WDNRNLYWSVRACKPCTPFNPGPWAEPSRRFRIEPSSPPPSCNPNADQIALYANTGYGGSCVTLGVGQYPNPGHLGSLGNDNAESIKVGSNVRGILYEHDNYAGRSETFTVDDSNLGDNTIGANAVSSVKVERRAQPPQDSESPQLKWVKPVGDGEVYEVTTQSVLLEVSATDNVGVARVHFSRWDAVNQRWVELGDDETSPYQATLDVSTLNLGWNQVNATANDSAGNWATKYIWLNRTSQALPDLVVQSISVPLPYPGPGQPIEIRVTIKNQGAGLASSVDSAATASDAATDRPEERRVSRPQEESEAPDPLKSKEGSASLSAGGFWVELYIDRVPTGLYDDGEWWWRVDSLAPGASRTLVVGYSGFTAGAHKLYAQVDSYAEIQESNEGNNIFGPTWVHVYPQQTAVQQRRPADVDGDGRRELIVWRPGNGRWYVLRSSTEYSYAGAAFYTWGAAGDTPLLGDLDKDGKDDLIVWRPGNGKWYVLLSSKAYSAAYARFYTWGAAGDVPLVGDVDGDGYDDLIVWRPSNGKWYVLVSSKSYSAAYARFYTWGAAGDVPLLGDLDGDGKDDLIVWRPSNGRWYVLLSTKGYATAQSWIFTWGAAGDTPLLGRLDGDTRDDPMVWRPSLGKWYALLSTKAYAPAQARLHHWGTSGDKPLLGRMDADAYDELIV
ncbi:MAG: hypothetical protein FJZ90_17425, partial [Chloroflexi bacterium]|nr:hypothetical protein [Chloroflexota bacterium]